MHSIKSHYLQRTFLKSFINRTFNRLYISRGFSIYPFWIESFIQAHEEPSTWPLFQWNPVLVISTKRCINDLRSFYILNIKFETVQLNGLIIQWNCQNIWDIRKLQNSERLYVPLYAIHTTTWSCVPLDAAHLQKIHLKIRLKPLTFLKLDSSSFILGSYQILEL